MYERNEKCVKYNIGDTARIKSKEEILKLQNKYGSIRGLLFHDDMFKFCGCEIKVIGFNINGYYHVNIGDKDFGWVYNDNMLEDIEEDTTYSLLQDMVEDFLK